MFQILVFEIVLSGVFSFENIHDYFFPSNLMGYSKNVRVEHGFRLKDNIAEFPSLGASFILNDVGGLDWAVDPEVIFKVS